MIDKIEERKEQHKKILDELNEIYVIKNKMYGNSFANTVLKYGDIAFLTRASDKFERLESIIINKNNANETDESLRDTLMDLANYLVMEVMILDNKGEIK